MDSILFGELVGVMTRKFTKEKKKIALAIDNCFAKARTLKEQQKSAQPDEDDLFKDLSNKTEKL